MLDESLGDALFRRFPTEDSWVNETTRVMAMVSDLITLGHESITISTQDAETLLLLIGGLIGSLESRDSMP